MDKTPANITIEDIRHIPEHANLSDEELQAIVDSIIELSQILMMLYVKKDFPQK